MPRENIVLIGFMGSGKSSVGRLIASSLDYRFVDTDQMIVHKIGAEISEIFRTQGEAFFRDEERQALELLQQGDRLVIATGGGIVTREANIPLLRKLGFVVWLTAREEIIFDRVSRNTKRPLLQTVNPRETISQLLVQRNPLYEAAAQFAFDTSDFPHGGIAEAIIEAAGRHFASESRT